MTLLSISAFALMSGAYVYGGAQLAAYAESSKPLSLGLSIAAYVAGNALLLQFLKSGSYGVLMVVSALAVLIGNALVSSVAFNEEYSALQAFGIALAGAAILLVGFGGDDGGVAA